MAIITRKRCSPLNQGTIVTTPQADARVVQVSEDTTSHQRRRIRTISPVRIQAKAWLKPSSHLLIHNQYSNSHKLNRSIPTSLASLSVKYLKVQTLPECKYTIPELFEIY